MKKKLPRPTEKFVAIINDNWDLTECIKDTLKEVEVELEEYASDKDIFTIDSDDDVVIYKLVPIIRATPTSGVTFTDLT